MNTTAAPKPAIAAAWSEIFQNRLMPINSNTFNRYAPIKTAINRAIAKSSVNTASSEATPLANAKASNLPLAPRSVTCTVEAWPDRTIQANTVAGPAVMSTNTTVVPIKTSDDAAMKYCIAKATSMGGRLRGLSTKPTAFAVQFSVPRVPSDSCTDVAVTELAPRRTGRVAGSVEEARSGYKARANLLGPRKSSRLAQNRPFATTVRP